MVYLDLIFNLSLLVALSVVSGFLDKRFSRETRAGTLLQGALFGGVAVLGMLRPLVMGPGLIFDGRTVMLSLCALFFGPRAALIASVMTLAYRVPLGGAGLIMGVSTILASSAIGLAAYYRFKPSLQPPSTALLYGMGLVVHAVMVSLMFTLPAGFGFATFTRLGLPVLLLYPLATILAGTVLSDHLSTLQAMAVLGKSEERFRMVFEAAGVGKSITLPTGKINVNQAFCNMLGYAKEELRNKKWQEITPPDEIEATQKMLDPLLQGVKDSVRFMKGYLHKNGSRIQADVSAVIQRDSKGQPLYFITTIVDISERVKAEENMQRAFHHLRRFMDSNIIGMIIAGADGKILMANDYYLALAGLTRGDFETGNVDWRAITPPEWLPADEKAIAAVREHGTSAPYEKEYIRSDGTRVPILIALTLLPDPDEQIAAFVLELTTLKRKEQELREKEIQYRNMANAGLTLIWTSGRDKLCSYFNQTWLTFTGRTLEQELGNGWTQGVHPEDLERCVKTYVNAFDQHQPFDMEYRLRRADGQYRWIRDLGTPNYSAGGEFIGYIGHCFDITGQKRSEEEIHKLNENLERMVNERTAELKKTIAQLEETSKVFVGRELKMMELKKRIAELEKN